MLGRGERNPGPEQVLWLSKYVGCYNSKCVREARLETMPTENRQTTNQLFFVKFGRVKRCVLLQFLFSGGKSSTRYSMRFRTIFPARKHYRLLIPSIRSNIRLRIRFQKAAIIFLAFYLDLSNSFHFSGPGKIFSFPFSLISRQARNHNTQ